MASIPGYRLSDPVFENERIGVYRGQRLSDGIPVIARAIRARYPEPREMARMRRDFEISSLLKISGILPALGLYPYGAGLAIVFQDMGGVPLVSVREMGASNLPGFLQLALGITRILADLHKNRIVHKDINPHNILLNEKTNELRITEFGISSTLTRENPVLLTPDRIEGTLAYISPEQTGRMNRTVDYRADFYSLGITFYQILTGKLPFTSTDPMELVHAHIAREIPEATQAVFGGPIPPAIQGILKKLTAKNAEDRYRSANGLIRDLEECMRQIQDNGKLGELTAGERDFSESFQIPQKLYGRDKEREALLSAFERVCEGETVFTVVSGRSGAGKTVLIQEILGPMTERKGYFTSGKFDQHRRDVPYSALIAAFEEIIRQLLTESKDKLQQWKERLVASFGSNGQVLLEVIPDLQLIVGEQGPVPDLPPTESRNRFHIVFQNFIRTFAAKEHPLTLFLDDLQWADGATLSLLRVLLTDPDSHCLLLVGSFRDNEVTDAHPLALALEDLSRSGVKPLDLKLSLLGPRDVRLLVADALALPPDKTSLAEDLADAVFKKTDGNPFFTGEFLKSLYQENLIFFSESVGHFSYDMFKIRAQVATDDLLRIISSNIRHLSSNGQDLIRLAACLGGHFDLRTFALCAEQTQARAAGELEELLVEGFIVAMDDSYKYAAFSNGQNELLVQYRFVHDQVHNAAYQQLAEDDKRQTHLKIARTLLTNLPFAERDERILELVHHMNQGRELILEPAERIQLIELNLQAGKKARDASAYEEALRLFGVAFDAMPANAVSSHYDIFIKTHSELGEISYILGENKVAEKHFTAILDKARTALEKVRVYELKIALHAGRGERAEAIRLGIEVLALLGMKIPGKPGSSAVKAELASAARALSGKSPDRLVDTHLMENTTELAAMRVLMQIATPAYGTNSDLFSVLVARMILHSLKHGNAPSSAYAYAAYAMLLCGDLGDPERGYRYGRLALDLVEKLQARDIKCRVYYLYAAAVHHWKHPASESGEYLLHAYQAGLETGDLEYVAAVSFLLTCSPLWIGHKPLREISQEIDRLGNPLYR
ncbi:MAG: serine/threonine-protein kinase PknK, partial [Spirochaetia bacterium]|nr:serine/threonine-protein kinase PknK [Spirochaetia bacterium]